MTVDVFDMYLQGVSMIEAQNGLVLSNISMLPWIKKHKQQSFTNSLRREAWPDVYTSSGKKQKEITTRQLHNLIVGRAHGK